MKLELKVEQANSSSDEEDLDVSQSSSENALNRKFVYELIFDQSALFSMSNTVGISTNGNRIYLTIVVIC
ncbi:hypothetical protein HA402_002183 [Bradysia odoriphaga]|nr:hypothetical protein HA402_002183 [Bradysia odoriphaga]